MKNIEIKDDFLSNDHLSCLDEIIQGPNKIPWFLLEEQVEGSNDGSFLQHMVYDEDIPRSPIYTPIIESFKNYLRYVSLCRITVNLLLKQETPTVSDFHTDFQHESTISDETRITTAIFYLNTNNGATEIKDGPRIDCVRNRLVMFPTLTPHRAIGQTDVNKRIVLNFNFIK
jgi:hypothetical protein